MLSPRQKIGRTAEDIALESLKRQGLTLVAQNYTTRGGEVDIIMLDKKNDTLVFVEVRHRKNAAFGRPAETVGAVKRKKIIRAAEYYLKTQRAHRNMVCRFDVVGVECDLRKPEIEWIKNAFD